MTFNPVAALNVIECKNLINEKSPKAIDLGSQTASINKIFIKNLLSQNKVSDSFLINNLVKLSESILLQRIFESVGFNDYKSIDLNGACKFQFDLNKY